MKPLILAAVLILSLFTMTMMFTLPQLLQTPKAMPNKAASLDFDLALYGSSPNSVDPGSGGGGQGVI